MTSNQVSSKHLAPFRARWISRSGVKTLNADMRVDSSRVDINKRATTLPSGLEVIPPLSIDVAETNTQVIMMEEIDPDRTNYMPKLDFRKQMDRFIAGIEFGIRTEGVDAEWKLDEDDVRLGKFVLSIVGGSGGRRPTYGDLRSTGIVLRDNIEHFSVSSRSYKEVQLYVVRIGTKKDLPLAIIDVFRGNSVSSGSLKGTQVGDPQACKSTGCLNLVATTK